MKVTVTLCAFVKWYYQQTIQVIQEFVKLLVFYCNESFINDEETLWADLFSVQYHGC